MPASADTIAALATPPGESALAVIRISGPGTDSILPALGRNADFPPPPRRFHRASYRGLNGELLDDLSFIYFSAPRSYTGEDMLELTTHGSPFIVEKILHDLGARGVRLAEPGEFTRAAFLNGKLDLAQAEAVVDLIRARSDRALAAAHTQLTGELGKMVEAFVVQLLAATAHLEAYIDFPEEDLPPEDHAGPRAELAALAAALERLAATQRYRERLQDGIKVVLLGEPNAGKSTLLNALVGEDRAIVSEEAGTTRDYIEVRALIGPHLVRLVDTAGLRESLSAVERAGVEHSLRLAREADVILLVVDRSAPAPRLDPRLAAEIERSPTLVVENKADLSAGNWAPDFLADRTRVRVGARDGQGIYELREQLSRILDHDYTIPPSADVIVSARHADALQQARGQIQAAIANLASAAPPELAAIDLHLAIEAMGQITGKIDNERVLDELFGSFCIGK